MYIVVRMLDGFFLFYTIYRYSCNYFVIVKTIAYYAAGEEYLYSFYIYIVNTILNVVIVVSYDY